MINELVDSPSSGHATYHRFWIEEQLDACDLGEVYWQLYQKAVVRGSKIQRGQIPKVKRWLGLSEGLVPPGPGAFSLEEGRILTCPYTSAPVITGHG